jgi:hypothetical protein
MINPYSTFGYISPPRGIEDNGPMYRSYQEHFERYVMIYYHWWAHRKLVTVESILWVLGLSDSSIQPTKDQLIPPSSINYEAAMSALRMHGVNVGYNETGKLVRY